MAREARERKAQGRHTRSPRHEETPATAPAGAESGAPALERTFDAQTAAIQPASAQGSSAQQHGMQRRSRASEQGEAIRRMRVPLGADDAADILGPRDEAPQEARVERIEERMRARKRLTTVQAMTTFGAIFATAGLVWIVFFSALFALDIGRIEIAGVDPSVPADAIHGRVAPFSGTPLTRLSTVEVEESIESIPQIKDAEVHKAWPNGLFVAYTVRTPAMVTQVNGTLVALDEEGIDLGPVAQRPTGVPVVTLPDDSEHRSSHAQGLVAAWRALPEEVRNRVDLMTVTDHQMTIALQGGLQVRWGTLNDEELKAKVLQVLLAQREAKVYDVSSPTSPVTSG